ncbi:MAG: DUF4163 domain-containing protein [Candidatus Riflebacteria bacterium]|nr:DUF4163 domain-containing protein [Candidatus Riflebacteria bacterium]
MNSQNFKSSIKFAVLNGNANAINKIINDYIKQNFKPDITVLEELYNDFEKERKFEESHFIIDRLKELYGEDRKYLSLAATAKKHYFDNLLYKGNSLLKKIKEDKVILEKNANSITFSKRIRQLSNEAEGHFAKAAHLFPDSTLPLIGLAECRTQINDPKGAAEFRQTIEEIKKEKLLQKRQILAPITQVYPIPEEEYNSFVQDVENAWSNASYSLLLELFENRDKRIKNLPLSMELMKAISLAKVKRFGDSDTLINNLQRLHGEDQPEIIETAKKIEDIKYPLLIEAGAFYLQKGIAAGSTFGKKHLLQALKAYEMAFTIDHSDIEVLNNFHMTLKYLGENERAESIRAMIYNKDQNFTPDYEKRDGNYLCFVASFACQNEPKKIAALRAFRRDVLFSLPAGTAINRLYMRTSPRLVSSMKYSARFKILSNFLITLFLKLLNLFNIQKG